LAVTDDETADVCNDAVFRETASDYAERAFVSRMGKLVPLAEFRTLIEPYYPKGEYL
jgi:hypothetical protein